MRRITALICAALMFAATAACGAMPQTEEEKKTAPETAVEDEKKEMRPTLRINGEKVDVSWEQNSASDALFELAKSEKITVEMSAYGGFEQVGNIGKTLPAQDRRLTTVAGDIVLYASNSLVIFYGSNTWEYTRLGHINLPQDRLESLLKKSGVTVTITLE